jgi:hypothetical protein
MTGGPSTPERTSCGEWFVEDETVSVSASHEPFIPLHAGPHIRWQPRLVRPADPEPGGQPLTTEWDTPR